MRWCRTKQWRKNAGAWNGPGYPLSFYGVRSTCCIVHVRAQGADTGNRQPMLSLCWNQALGPFSFPETVTISPPSIRTVLDRSLSHLDYAGRAWQPGSRVPSRLAQTGRCILSQHLRLHPSFPSRYLDPLYSLGRGYRDVLSISISSSACVALGKNIELDKVFPATWGLFFRQDELIKKSRMSLESYIIRTIKVPTKYILHTILRQSSSTMTAWHGTHKRMQNTPWVLGVDT